MGLRTSIEGIFIVELSCADLGQIKRKGREKLKMGKQACRNWTA